MRQRPRQNAAQNDSRVSADTLAPGADDPNHTPTGSIYRQHRSSWARKECSKAAFDHESVYVVHLSWRWRAPVCAMVELAVAQTSRKAAQPLGKADQAVQFSCAFIVFLSLYRTCPVADSVLLQIVHCCTVVVDSTCYSSIGHQQR